MARFLRYIHICPKIRPERQEAMIQNRVLKTNYKQ